MYQEVLQQIEGVGIFPVISLLLFVTLFTGALVGAIRMDRRRAAQFAAMAVDSEESRDDA